MLFCLTSPDQGVYTQGGAGDSGSKAFGFKSVVLSSRSEQSKGIIVTFWLLAWKAAVEIQRDGIPCEMPLF